MFGPEPEYLLVTEFVLDQSEHSDLGFRKSDELCFSFSDVMMTSSEHAVLLLLFSG